jgi:hypothetical protein
VPPFLLAAVPLLILLVTVVVVALRARRRGRAAKPAREPSAFLLLEGNAWDACTVDDAREPWGRYTTEPVRGFCGVLPGRHRIVTTTAAGDATLDFVVYPGEILSWRLDADRARWEPHDLNPETRSLLESVPGSTSDLASVASAPKTPGYLVHLRTTVALVRSRSSAPPAKADDEAADRVRKRFAKLVARADADGPAAEGDHLAEARGLGEALVGRALSRREMRALVAPARDSANRHVSNGDTERAMGIVALGLALLPGDPELMVVAGCALAARGEADEALRALNAALERDRCLEADDLARAMRLRLELRSRLGRSVRV